MDILSEKKLPKRSFSGYKRFVSEKIYQKLESESKELKGISIMHINSTAIGGGVAEILKSQVALEKGLGLKSYWLTLNGGKEDDFFTITKKIHNFLQGDAGSLTSGEKKKYLLHNQSAFGVLKEKIKSLKPDIVIIHDPQPLPLIEAIPEDVKMIFRFHIDLSTPNKKVLDFLKPFIMRFDNLVVSNSRYKPLWFSKEKTRVIYPSIDPFSDKNVKMEKREIERRVYKSKIKKNIPLFIQVSRLDPWKDPVGVIEAFEKARKKEKKYQLALVYNLASDDPEGKEMEKIVKKKKDNSLYKNDIHLINGDDPRDVNALQRYADVVIQKSTREGFGLTVTEAMWKSKTVIGGKTTGISTQIKNGSNGFLVSSVKETADLMIELIEDKKLNKKLGRAARKTVQANFLTTTMVLNHIKLYKTLHKS